jgi:hypothetical protein
MRHVLEHVDARNFSGVVVHLRDTDERLLIRGVGMGECHELIGFRQAVECGFNVEFGLFLRKPEIVMRCVVRALRIARAQRGAEVEDVLVGLKLGGGLREIRARRKSELRELAGVVRALPVHQRLRLTVDARQPGSAIGRDLRAGGSVGGLRCKHRCVVRHGERDRLVERHRGRRRRDADGGSENKAG